MRLGARDGEVFGAELPGEPEAAPVVGQRIDFPDIAIAGSKAPLIPASLWPWLIGAGVLAAVWWFQTHGRRVRSNPDDEIAEAEHAFEGFHWGRAPRKRTRVATSPAPRALVKLGRLEAVTYSTKKGGEPFAHYEHQFGEGGKSRPVLAMDPANRRLHIVGGGYDVEDRGIVG